jgi:hypothetical protein
MMQYTGIYKKKIPTGEKKMFTILLATITTIAIFI